MRSYTSAIIVGFLVVALSVVGLRWHALAQRANTPVPVQLASYAPPHRSDGGRGSAPIGQSVSGQSRGVSPSKAPTRPADDTAADSSAASDDTQTADNGKGKSKSKSKHTSAPKVLPKEHSIDINHATQEQLVALPGIGPSIAGRIISYRNEHGLFKSVDELDQVKGIGPKKLEKIKPYCYVDKG